MSRKYTVTIEEHLVKKVEIDAKTRAEAEDEAQSRWNNEEWILDADDFSHVDFDAEIVPEHIGKIVTVHDGEHDGAQGVVVKEDYDGESDLYAISISGNENEYIVLSEDEFDFCEIEENPAITPEERAVYEKVRHAIMRDEIRLKIESLGLDDDIIPGVKVSSIRNDSFFDLAADELSSYTDNLNDDELWHVIGNCVEYFTSENEGGSKRV